VDISRYHNVHSVGNRVARVLWGVVWLLLFRPSPRPCHCWRRMLLRLFGAKIGKGVNVYPSCKIWAPWNLEMGDHSCLSFDVDCYCVAPIRIGANSTVSQYSYLCAASHDFTKAAMPLVTAPIVIEDQAWVCADCFVAMGVTIGQGAVVGARSNVTKSVPPWTVAAGNPAKVIRPRQITSEQS
jgi:putative colanic acid biosynthesis acetyltransferase WcaF